MAGSPESAQPHGNRGRRRDKGKGKGTSHKDQQREADLQKAKEAAQRRQEREQRELQIARLQRGDDAAGCLGLALTQPQKYKNLKMQ